MTQQVRKFAERHRRLLMLAVLCAPWLLGGCASAPAPEVVVAPPPAPPPATLDSYIAEASQRFNVPEAWIRAVMAQESGGRTHVNGQPIVSRKGAMGLMQVMPSTWASLRDTYKLGNDPFEPHDNIMAGTAYIREMFDQYGSPGFLAAYNAGPGRYQTHLRTHRPLPGETRHYVAVIAPKIGGIYPIGPSPARIAVAAARAQQVATATPAGTPLQVAALPAPIPAQTPVPVAVAVPEASPTPPAPTPALVRTAPVTAPTPIAIPVPLEPAHVLAAVTPAAKLDAQPEQLDTVLSEADEPAPEPKRTRTQHASTPPRPTLQLARAGTAHSEVPHPQRRPTLPPGWYVPTPHSR